MKTLTIIGFISGILAIISWSAILIIDGLDYGLFALLIISIIFTVSNFIIIQESKQ